MCNCKPINHEQVDFDSPKLSEAKEMVRQHKAALAEKMCEPVDVFSHAYENGDVLVGVFTTPCGKPCVFVEYNRVQAVAPLDQAH